MKNYNNITDYHVKIELLTLSVLVKNNPLYYTKEIFIIGGEKIYNMYFNLLNKYSIHDLQLNNIYLTYINRDYKCDTFFKNRRKF